MAEHGGGEPVFAVTMGDPAGIGPDIALMAWAKREEAASPPFFVTGSPSVLLARAKLLGLPVRSILEISQPGEAAQAFRQALPVLPAPGAALEAQAGRPEARFAKAIIGSIELACALALDGRAAGVITNPIAKHVLLAQGFAHAGHTEFLGEIAARHGHARRVPVMLLASERLKVVPVTVHIPLKDVPGSLSAERIVQAAEITANDLRRYFGIERPRLAVCGLNPHAGEEGELGHEEIDIIAPAIRELASRGLAVSGPHPADTLFHDEARQAYDAVLAMYHDQGLIPFKTLSFEDGVNVTLGLPFIRTSPDHGTAFSLAGTGRARPTSFIAAIKLAKTMHDAERARSDPAAP